MLIVVFIQGVSAQLADGFYHFKNTVTGRYISINDTDPEHYKVNMEAGDINMGGFRTYVSYDTVAVSPSCVIYVRRLDNGKYDFCGQGTSLNALSAGKIGVNLIPLGGDTYKITGTYKGFEKVLADGSPSSEDSWLMNRLTETQQWKAIPINTSDEYIGIKPDVRTADGEYYGTVYAGFSFRLASSGMQAYYVSSAQGSSFTMEEIGLDVIPASTPVIVKCNSSDPADNKIEPVSDHASFGSVNCLDGVYCSLTGVAKHRNITLYDFITMRVIGLDDKGRLAFTTAGPESLYKNTYLKANKAYLRVDGSAAEVMTVGTETAIENIKSDGENTIIRFKVADNIQKASINIYDLRGKILKKFPVSSGNGSISVGRNDIGEGMFLYSLIVNGQEIDTKKMIILK